MRVRRADLKDLSHLVEFTSEEAREAEGSVKIPETLEKGNIPLLMSHAARG